MRADCDFTVSVIKTFTWLPVSKKVNEHLPGTRMETTTPLYYLGCLKWVHIKTWHQFYIYSKLKVVICRNVILLSLTEIECWVLVISWHVINACFFSIQHSIQVGTKGSVIQTLFTKQPKSYKFLPLCDCTYVQYHNLSSVNIKYL